MGGSPDLELEGAGLMLDLGVGPLLAKSFVILAAEVL